MNVWKELLDCGLASRKRTPQEQKKFRGYNDSVPWGEWLIFALTVCPDAVTEKGRQMATETQRDLDEMNEAIRRDRAFYAAAKSTKPPGMENSTS